MKGLYKIIDYIVSQWQQIDYEFGTVGKPLPNVDIKIAKDGEILIKSDNVMKEYYNNDEANDINNAKEVVLTRRLVGLWPQDLADMTLDSNSSETVTLDVTWSYEDHEDL